MKKLLPLWMGLSLALITGCSSVQTETKSAEDTAEARISAQLIGDRMLNAFQKNQPENFLRNLPENMKKAFGEKEFRSAYANLNRTLGKPVSHVFLAELETPVFQTMLWKVRFERRISGGKKIIQEAVFRLITGNLDNKTTVISFNFL